MYLFRRQRRKSAVVQLASKEKGPKTSNFPVRVIIIPLGLLKMLPQKMKKAITDNPKQLANLIDLVNLPSTLRDFVGQSQISHLGCFVRVWSYIKTNNLQDPNNKNVVNCDEKLKSILLGKQQVELVELPALIKLHFPKQKKFP
ncbi:hypothetical protein OIU85_009446 [Salix viminalis]|uniref:DM2 domain-containing protein n=1 Tax=Salix viminalis TaxID=40686 RepID=A0A9Q0NUH5_SALVM|nr:hypothetical protein OIU85_009446 [Salix viminalis]